MDAMPARSLVGRSLRLKHPAPAAIRSEKCQLHLRYTTWRSRCGGDPCCYRLALAVAAESLALASEVAVAAAAEALAAPRLRNASLTDVKAARVEK